MPHVKEGKNRFVSLALAPSSTAQSSARGQESRGLSPMPSVRASSLPIDLLAGLAAVHQSLGRPLP